MAPRENRNIPQASIISFLSTSVFLCKRQIGLRDFSSPVFDYFYALLFLLDIYILYIYIYIIYQRVYIRCIHQNHQAGNNTRVFWHRYRKVKVALVFRQFYFYRHFSPRALLQTWLFRCLGNQYMSIVQNGSCARGIPEASTQDRSAPVPREVLFAALAGLQRRYPPQTPQPSPRSTALTLPQELARANPAAVSPPTCEATDVPVAYPLQMPFSAPPVTSAPPTPASHVHSDVCLTSFQLALPSTSRLETAEFSRSLSAGADEVRKREGSLRTSSGAAPAAHPTKAV